MTRASFVATFGEAAARAIEDAGNSHRGELVEGSDYGPDPFRDAIAIAIGFECFTNPSYRKYHGIRPSAKRIKAWVREHGDLAHHVGPKNYLSLVVGAYNEYMPDFDEAKP